MKWRWRPLVGLQWLFLRSGPGATNHFEAGGFVAEQRGRRLPEPHVPFPADRGALRRIGAGERPRLPGAHRPDVLGRARLREDHEHGPDRASGAALQLPLDRSGPPRVGRGDPRGAGHPEPAGVRSVQRRRALAGAERGDRRGDPGVGREGRRDRVASLLHGADGHGRPLGGGPADDARARPRRTSRRGRLGDAVRDERQHLRAGDDGGREGRRPDPREHAAPAREGRVLPSRGRDHEVPRHVPPCHAHGHGPATEHRLVRARARHDEGGRSRRPHVEASADAVRRRARDRPDGARGHRQ